MPCVTTMFEGDAESWPLVRDSRRVDQVQVDFRFSLVLDDGTLVVVESPFVATIDGVRFSVTPETLEGVGNALVVLHRDLSDLRAFRRGGLRIALADGGLIEVSPGDAYESWQVILPDGSQFIGLPGGAVGTFPARE
jgi:hypothetical protein